MKSVQSAALEEEPVLPPEAWYGSPIRVGTLAPPSPFFRRDASAFRFAAIAAETGKHRLTSASERINMSSARVLEMETIEVGVIIEDLSAYVVEGVTKS